MCPLPLVYQILSTLLSFQLQPLRNRPSVEETKAPNGYLLDGAYMQAGDKSEQIKGLYVTQIIEDGDLAVLSGSNQFSISDKVIRGGVKIQKRDLETLNISTLNLIVDRMGFVG